MANQVIDRVIELSMSRSIAPLPHYPITPLPDYAITQWDVLSRGSRTTYQLSQSEKEPPARVTVSDTLSDGTSQCWRARPPSIGTRYGLSRFSGESCSRC